MLSGHSLDAIQLHSTKGSEPMRSIPLGGMSPWELPGHMFGALILALALSLGRPYDMFVFEFDFMCMFLAMRH